MTKLRIMKAAVALAALLVGLLVAAPARADSVGSEWANCQISWSPAGPWQVGDYYTDPFGVELAIYRLGSEQTGGSSSACEDINFTPHGPQLWHQRTYARAYVCAGPGLCIWGGWRTMGEYGGVVFNDVGNGWWYYVEYASFGAGATNPYGNLQLWD